MKPRKANPHCAVRVHLGSSKATNRLVHEYMRTSGAIGKVRSKQKK